MAIKLEVSTTVVSGLSLVENHHGGSRDPFTSESSSATSGTHSSEEEASVGSPRAGVDRGRGARAPPEVDRTHASQCVEPSDDRTAGGADGAASGRASEMAVSPDALVFRRGGFFDRLGVNFLRAERREQRECVSSPPAMTRDDRSLSRRGSLLVIFARLGHRHIHPSSLRSLSENQGQVATKTAPVDAEEEGAERRPSSLLQTIADDFRPGRGDQKILRAVGRTATVNAVVLVTAAAGGATIVAGYATGGVIASKRVYHGLLAEDEREVTKALAVYGAATAASVLGQTVAGVVMLGLVGAGLPATAAVAFVVGCVSGITAGALSEWTVDGLIATFGAVSDLTVESVLETLAGMGACKVLRADRAAAVVPQTVFA